MRRVALVAALLCAAAPLVMAMDNPLPTLKVDQYTLSNGLTVFLVEDHTLPLVSVNINYMVGSKNERPGRTGFAHLFEHMMFQGSKHYNDDFFKPLQDIGGAVNGGTNTDRTRYWELLPAGYLERALWLEADRMGFLLDAMTQERLANQISVVQNERRQNYENRPYGTVNEKILAVTYPPNHPYNWPTIGSIADLQAASLDDVKEFFRTYYTPNNASLCVSGDFDPKVAKELIEKYFGAIPPGPPVSRIEAWTPQLSGEISLAIEDRVQLPRTYISWPTVPIYSEDDSALDAFTLILGGGKTSRLYQKLVYEQQIAQDALAFHNSGQLTGGMQIILTPRPGNDPTAVEKAALAVLAEALDKGVTAEELDRVKSSITADAVRAMQNIGGFGGISDKVNEYYHYRGKADLFRWDLQRYLDLTPERVNAVARRVLGERRVVARVSPMPQVEASASPVATSVARETMPGRGPESAFTLPPRQRFKLANGLEVVLVEWHKLPLVGFDLIVRGGTAADPANRPGLASLTAALLQEGAGGLTSTQIAEKLETLGAQVDVAATQDAVLAQLSTLKSRLDESLAIYTDILTRPDFPKDELERQRKRRIVQLTQLADQPQYLAMVAMTRALFGDHPYGHVAMGDKGSLTAVTLDDVKGFWKSNYTPANATLLVVGDVTRAELETRLAANLGSWKGGPAPKRALKPAAAPTTRTVYLVDKPGAAQSVIAVGLPGVARSTEDYATLQVLNTVLGGQFVSRLNLNLREDKGYTYGARSNFNFAAVPGGFTAGAPVQTKVTAAALKEIVAELDGVAGARPITETELAYAIGTITNGYARRFETPEQIVRELVDSALYGLADNALETYPKQVAAVSGATVAAAGKKYVQPARLVIVVVGDKAAIEKDLAALNLGPVVTLDKEGKPVAE